MLDRQNFEDRAQASVAAAAFISDKLNDAIEESGDAVVALSGGSSPIGMYNQLRDKPIDWSKVSVTLTDERMVPPNHKDSNAGMLQRELLSGDASTARFISLFRGTHRLNDAETDLQDLKKPYDIVLLGMGEDGHVASLFPEAPGLPQKFQSENSTELAMTSHQESVRITLTPKELLNARHIALLFFGDSKEQVFNKALEGEDVSKLPVRFVLNQEQVPVTVFWAP